MTDDQDNNSENPKGHKADYDVGYRKPPLAHRFKDGNRANPKGRRKSAPVVDLATLVQQIGAEQAEAADGTKRSNLERVLRALVADALKGDSQAARSIFDRAYKHALTKPMVQKSFFEITDLGGEFGELVRAHHAQKGPGPNTDNKQ